MKKKVISLFVCSALLALLSTPAFAITVQCSFCGGYMTQTIQYSPWLTAGHTDCTHGKIYAQDTKTERLAIITYICPRCGQGFTEEHTEEATRCMSTKRRNLILPEGEVVEGDTCSVCYADAVVTETHNSPWLTIATDENGISTQERLIIKTDVCSNCGRGGTTEETETQTVRLHK